MRRVTISVRNSADTAVGGVTGRQRAERIRYIFIPQVTGSGLTPCPRRMESLPWIVAFIAMALLAALLAMWAFPARRSKKIAPLPTEWALPPRPVFSTDERRVYRLLREAL